MINIRNGLFETNSSSMHSIVITPNSKVLTRDDFCLKDWDGNEEHDILITNDKNEIVLYRNNEYGRGFNILYTFYDKIQFALASLCGAYQFESDVEEMWKIYNNIVDTVREVIPDISGFQYRKTHEDLFFDENGNEYTWSQILYKYDNIDRKKGNNEYIVLAWNEDDDSKVYEFRRNEEEYLELPDFGYIDHQSMGLLQRFLKEKNITLKDFLFNQRYVVIIDGDEYYMFDKVEKSGAMKINYVERFE